MTAADPWATLFADALTNSHHRDWSEDMVIEAALICADVARKVMAKYAEQNAVLAAAVLAQAAPDDPESEEIGHEGYL